MIIEKTKGCNVYDGLFKISNKDNEVIHRIDTSYLMSLFILVI